MIKAEYDSGDCVVKLSGRAAVLAAETGALILAIYNGIREQLPTCAHNSFGNIYRITILKALTECTPENKQP